MAPGSDLKGIFFHLTRPLPSNIWKKGRRDLDKLGISSGSRVVSGFDQVGDGGLGIGHALELNAVCVKNSAPPCRFTCPATGKGWLEKTGENSSSFM